MTRKQELGGKKLSRGTHINSVRKAPHLGRLEGWSTRVVEAEDKIQKQKKGLAQAKAKKILLLLVQGGGVSLLM